MQKFLSLTRHVFNPQSVLISKRTWDRFSPDEKALLQAAATEAAVYQRQASREQTGKSIELIKQAGVAVNEVAPDGIERIRQRIKPVVEKFTKEIDPEVAQQVQTALSRKLERGRKGPDVGPGQAAVVAICHACIAPALKLRSVRRETRWR